jgi:hypothetical protein
MNRHLGRALGIGLALGAAATLAACTAGDPDDPVTSAPSVTETAEVTETVYGECVDGLATILADDLDGPFELGDCATVSVVGVDGAEGDVAVDRLVLEGDRNTVVVDEVAHVAFGGDGNIVEHGGGAPEVVDDGSDNRVGPRG